MDAKLWDLLLWERPSTVNDTAVYTVSVAVANDMPFVDPLVNAMSQSNGQKPQGELAASCCCFRRVKHRRCSRFQSFFGSNHDQKIREFMGFLKESDRRNPDKSSAGCRITIHVEIRHATGMFKSPVSKLEHWLRGSVTPRSRTETVGCSCTGPNLSGKRDWS